VKSWARTKRCCETRLLRRTLETHPGLALIGTLFSLATTGGLAPLVWQLHAAPAENSGASAGSLRVEVQDAGNRQRVAARCYLTDGSGKPWNPAGAFTYDKRQEHHFISQGTFDIAVPPGRYLLRVERGPEYQPWEARLTLQAGKTHSETVRLIRWIDMNKRGWYSGDLHNHRPPEQIASLLLAEDLNLAPVLADWVWEDRQRSNAPATTDPFRKVDPTHVYSLLDKEVERLKEGPGAVDLLGLKSVVPFEGYRLYPPNDRFCEAAHAQGGYVDAEKIVWRDVVALVALGHIDFAGIVHNHFNRHDVEFETDSWGMIPKDRPELNTVAGMPLWSMEIYYRFLNCGFRLPVSAGSASGVKAAPLGYNRVYVKTPKAFGYDSWFEALKQGRSFATNGPMLFLRVNGGEVGSTLSLGERRPVSVSIEVEAATMQPLDRVEVLFKGRIVHTSREPDSSGKWRARFTREVGESGWFVARCFERAGSTIRFAHTSPIYLRFDGDAGIVAPDAQFLLKWIEREIAFYQAEPGFKEPSHREEMIGLFQKAKAVYEKLAQ
jgi:hypothetical protein